MTASTFTVHPQANGRLEEARAIMDQLKQEKENVKGQIVSTPLG